MTCPHCDFEKKENALIEEYGEWMMANGLELGSADEHLWDENLTTDQRKWLADFCIRWDNMMKEHTMPKLTREFVKKLHGMAFEELQELAKEQGLEVHIAGGSFDGEGKCTLKFEFVDSKMNAETEKREFEAYAKFHGLEPTDYGRTFTVKGRKLKIIGLHLNSKFAVRCQDGPDVRRFRAADVAKQLRAC